MTFATLPATDLETGHRLDFLLVADMVEPGSRVLDIGCGDGSWRSCATARASTGAASRSRARA
jgi:cyclopropane fatty-acyl-phospholipid synthase-like methyltransferase